MFVRLEFRAMLEHPVVLTLSHIKPFNIS